MMKIETRTTGFSSPAADYAHSRLTLCEEKIKDPYYTFYFRVKNPIDSPEGGDEILIVSRMVKPNIGDECVGVSGEPKRFVVYKFGQNVHSHWGVIIGRTFQL